MSSFFALIVPSVPSPGNAQTSCSVYIKPNLAVVQQPKSSPLKESVTHINQTETNSLLSNFNRVITNGC